MAGGERRRGSVVPCEGLAAGLEGRLVWDVFDEVEDKVFDDAHVGWPVLAPQAHQVVMEDDIERPVEAVLDAPVGSGGEGELLGGEAGGREIVPAGGSRPSVSLHFSLDHADGGESRKARFVGKASAGRERSDVVGDAAASGLDAPVVAVDGNEEFILARGFALEEEPHVLGEGRPVVFEREQIIGALGADRLGDFALAAHGVDGDEGALDLQPLDEQGDGDNLVAFPVDGLLAEHQALPGGPGGDEVQQCAAGRVGATRSLAVNGNDVGRLFSQTRDRRQIV